MTKNYRVCAGFLVFGALTVADGSVAWAQATQPDPYATPGSSGLQAGGLTPIGSGNQATPTGGYDPGAATTEQTIKTAEKEDSGRGLEFVWLNAEAGYQILGLQTFKANDLVDAQVVKSKQNGLLFGAGAGIRLFVLTLGARFRLGNFDNSQLWTLGAEAGLHLPMGRVEPYFTAGVGYASLGAFDVKKSTIDLEGAGVDIHGWNARVGFGLDVYVTNVVSLGANLTGDALFLTRPGVDASKLASGNPDVKSAEDVYAKDGSSIGAAMTATAVVGLHF
jgi:opacity protein-like surface antigen